MKKDSLDKMIAWENGELDEQGTIELFQGLVNSGMAWRLQGMYGRQAAALLEAGLIHPPSEKSKENQTDFYGNPKPAERLYKGKGWHQHSIEHSNARRFGSSGRAHTRKRKDKTLILHNKLGKIAVRYNPKTKEVKDISGI